MCSFVSILFQLMKLMLIASDTEHSVSPTTVLKRRAQALVIFVGLASGFDGSLCLSSPETTR